MSKSTLALVSCLALVLLILANGCSDDKKTTEPTTVSNPVQLVALDSIIREVAPPEFTSPVTSPGDMDSAWLYGGYPLMGKVFGSDDPQTLYRNIDDFTAQLQIIEYVARVDADNHLIAGVYTDSVEIDMGDGLVMMHFTATVTALPAPVTMPTCAQAVMGSTSTTWSQSMLWK
jgi:hypothetical protein